ncbi:MAG: hypothetical protein JWP69_2294 [Flaviaesturariibacter sp.]|nr:hypothetical protein [Flaviaesturariibacter sp.]
MKKASLIFLFIVLLTSCDSNNSSEKPSTSSSTKAEASLTCNECGTTFQKSSGKQLSGHSEVFCSDRCATKWGFSHGISVQ